MRSRRLLARSAIVSFLVLIPALAVGIIVVDLDGPGTTVAAAGFKAVQGYVYDILGYPIEGVSVTVDMVNASTELVTASEPGMTGSDGFYGVVFDMTSVWQPGDTIRVTATYDSLVKVNTTIADSGPSQDVDVHFETVIPEFSGLVGPVIAVAVFVCLAGFLSRRRV